MTCIVGINTKEREFKKNDITFKVLVSDKLMSILVNDFDIPKRRVGQTTYNYIYKTFYKKLSKLLDVNRAPITMQYEDYIFNPNKDKEPRTGGLLYGDNNQKVLGGILGEFGFIINYRNYGNNGGDIFVYIEDVNISLNK